MAMLSVMDLAVAGVRLKEIESREDRFFIPVIVAANHLVLSVHEDGAADVQAAHDQAGR